MNHPVTCISFRDALAYCNWKKVRLPTLDEWEIACRAGNANTYFWGNEQQKIHQYGNIWRGKNHLAADVSEDFIYTAPVAHYKPNAWNLYDMYGNVFEFCSDRPQKLIDNPTIACARGGSWWCSEKSCNSFNSTDIGRVSKIASFSNLGFRVVTQ